MKYISCELTNWMQHANKKIIFHKFGTNAIWGDNDVGKSSILKAMCWCLDSSNSEYGNKFDIRDGETYCVVEVIIEVDQQIYTLSKKIENANKVTSTHYSINEEPFTATEYAENLDKILLDAKCALSLIISKQQQIHGDIRDKPAERNKRLRAILKIQESDIWSKNLKKIVEEEQNHLVYEQGSIFAEEISIQEQIANLETEKLKTSNALPKLNLEEATQELEKAKKTIQIIDNIQTEETKLNENVNQLKEINQKLILTKLQEGKIQISEDINSLELQIKNSKLAKEKTQIESLQKQLNEIKNNGHNLETLQNHLFEIQTLQASINQKNDNINSLSKKKIKIDQDSLAKANLSQEWWDKNPTIEKRRSLTDTKQILENKIQELQLNQTRIKEQLTPVKGTEASVLLDRIYKYNKSQCPITGSDISLLNDTTVALRKKILDTQGDSALPNDTEQIIKLALALEESKNELEIINNGINLQILEYLEATTILDNEKTSKQLDEEIAKSQKELIPMDLKLNILIKTRGLKETQELINTVEKRTTISQILDSTKSKLSKEELNSIQNDILVELNDQELDAINLKLENTRSQTKLKEELANEIKASNTFITMLNATIEQIKQNMIPLKQSLNIKIKQINGASVLIFQDDKKEQVEQIRNSWEKEIAIYTEKREIYNKIILQISALKATKQKLIEKKEKILQEEKTIEEARNVYKFLSAKKAPQQLLRMALIQVVEETNQLLPKVGLDLKLGLDKASDFTITRIRNKKVVTEPASRLGTGLATLLGICLKLSLIKVVMPNLQTIIFDEPSDALHESRSKELGNFFRNIQEINPELQIIIVEHDSKVADACNNKIII